MARASTCLRPGFGAGGAGALCAAGHCVRSRMRGAVGAVAVGSRGRASGTCSCRNPAVRNDAARPRTIGRAVFRSARAGQAEGFAGLGRRDWLHRRRGGCRSHARPRAGRPSPRPGPPAMPVAPYPSPAMRPAPRGGHASSAAAPAPFAPWPQRLAPAGVHAPATAPPTRKRRPGLPRRLDWPASTAGAGA